MTEEWKDIIGYEGIYKISKKGIVKRIYKTVPERNVKTTIAGNGYLRFSASYRNNKKDVYIHKEIAKLFIPNPENKPCINHKDFNRINNDIENLEWCTYSENMDYSRKNGRFPSQKGIANGLDGERNGSSKLKNKDIVKIRKLYGTSKKKDLAKLYNITTTQLWKISKNKAWRNVS